MEEGKQNESDTQITRTAKEEKETSHQGGMS